MEALVEIDRDFILLLYITKMHYLYMKGKCQLLVCNTYFGMGITLKNILVIHNTAKGFKEVFCLICVIHTKLSPSPILKINFPAAVASFKDVSNHAVGFNIRKIISFIHNSQSDNFVLPFSCFTSPWSNLSYLLVNSTKVVLSTMHINVSFRTKCESALSVDQNEDIYVYFFF